MNLHFEGYIPLNWYDEMVNNPLRAKIKCPLILKRFSESFVASDLSHFVISSVLSLQAKFNTRKEAVEDEMKKEITQLKKEVI